MSEKSPEDRHWSPDEAREQLEGLKDADRVRLNKIAALYAHGTSIQPDDLFQEACEKLLAGDRKWPRDVDLGVFLSRAMKSLAWAARERDKAGPVVGAEDVNDPDGSGATIEAPNTHPEHRLVAARDYKGLQQSLMDLVEDDEEAASVMLSKFEGMSAEEIRQTLGMDKTRYATVLKRMRRTIEKAYPKGWTNGKRQEGKKGVGTAL